MSFNWFKQKISFVDITRRKVAEEKLLKLSQELEQKVLDRTEEINRSEKRYRNLFENNPMPMWIFDLATFEFLDVNEAAISHYGYSRWEFLSMTALDIRSDEDKELFKKLDHATDGRATNPNRGIWKHLKKDGSMIYVDIIVHEIIFEGKPARLVLSNDVTERVKMEEMLKESFKEISDYKFAIDESSIVAITDQKGIIKHANDNFCKISKYSREELIGQDHRIINSGYHPKEFIRDLWLTIANGKIWKGELKNKAKDGSTYWVDTTIIPFLNENEKPYQYVAIRADITERKKLEEQQVLFASIVNSSDDAIISKTLDGRITSWNHGAEKVFGYLSKEIIGQHISILIPSHLQNEEIEIIEKVRNGEVVDHYQTRRVRKDGKVIPVSLTISPIKDSFGNIIGASKISRDITEQKAAEENLQKSLREITDYKYALDESSIVAITDQKGIIKYVNNNFCKISKYPAEELVGQDHRIINSGYHSKEFIRNLWVTIAKGKIWRGELKNSAKDGTIYWVDTTIVPFLNEQDKPYQYVAIRADITGRKLAEEENLKLNEDLELRVKQRTEELEAFSYSVSHDLRAPLRAINGFAKILDENYSTVFDTEAIRLFNRIEENAKKMGALIDDLLEFSKLGRKEIYKSPVQMTQLVERTLLEINTTVHQKAAVKIHQLHPANADSTMIKQVVINLLSNAIKYSAKTGKPSIEVKSHLEANEIIYSVSDNGVGFNNQYADKLFGVFQRLHLQKDFEGTGVGLALVKRIINKHGGRVWAEGELNKGATFFFSLPATNNN